MKISVSGLGKVGLPLSAVIADAGFDVIGIDIDQQRIDRINKGENPLSEEPGLAELLQKHSGKALVATTDGVQAVKDTEFHIVIVPLFIDENHNADFSILRAAFTTVGKGLKKGDVVVLETTVPVGTTDGMARKILETESGLKAGNDFYLAYSPERIMTGKTISRYREFPKVIGGIDETSGKKALKIYCQFCKQIDIVSSARTAEMIKISEGIYRDVNIALANELYKVCQEYQLNFDEVREKANHKFCDILKHSIGVGGHCIPVYPWFIIKDFKERNKEEDTIMINYARKVNDDMTIYWKDMILEKLKKSGKDLKTTKILIKGLTYRPGVKETIYSRSIALYKEIEKAGGNVFAYDMILNKEEIKELGLNYSYEENCDYVFDAFKLEGRTVK